MTDGLTHNMTALEAAGERALPAAEDVAKRFKVLPHPAPASDEAWAKAMEELDFGAAYSDHMARAVWTKGEGWHSKQIVPFGPLTLSPAAAVLHYGQEIFEGMKAYRHDDGSIWTFRPAYNAARFNASAKRMCMPQLEVEDFVGAIAALVKEDAKWVPTPFGSSLYLRPVMFASEAFLGVHAASEYTFLTIATPVGLYFKDGLSPVSIWVADDYHRAGPGGTGAAKTGGNYAGALLPQEKAAEAGFDQVCFLDARENQYLEELGGMNVFVVRSDGSVVTPALTGTILEGSTRSAIIRLLRDRGTPVFEERIRLADLADDIKRGEVTEMFACGTAAVVTPIGRLASTDFDLEIPGTAVTLSVYNQLVGIQNGEEPDPYNWLYRIA
ncbi:branched-chain amino acid aminotransferase [Gleimia europaea]|uniref:branched-chain-amino-acid transaminase n=1 Tax=Gleimia europaea ACS-120-V-Col10b TaxID=883069 RepID=A0A9W5RCX6_9ACTO|nr:branched-chain amino acid aminotransferase [Gleimia europaea]EPD29423.1 branched-chain amino acid aminotransferase [Gleimia europaea ACS-120-V-Col10b]